MGTVFPLGSAAHAITEATIGDLEKWCVTHALGFVPGFRTHALAGPTGNEPFVLTPPDTAQANPFWVVGAAKEVIDGHGGIWQTPFLQFIASLVFQHVQASKQGPSGGVATEAPAEVADRRAIFAEFAKSIGRSKCRNLDGARLKRSVPQGRVPPPVSSLEISRNSNPFAMRPATARSTPRGSMRPHPQAKGAARPRR